MFQSRYLIKDPDIDRICKSPILRTLADEYDAAIQCDGDLPIFYYIDPAQRFWFALIDEGAEFSVDMEKLMATDDWMNIPSSVTMCVLRVIYVVKHHRGKGLQSRVINRIIELCEEYGLPMCVFVDPFELKYHPEYRPINASNSLHIFTEAGYTEADNYSQLIINERKKYLNKGFRNIQLINAKMTKPYQQLSYIPSTADDKVKTLADNLEVHYEIAPQFKHLDN